MGGGYWNFPRGVLKLLIVSIILYVSPLSDNKYRNWNNEYDFIMSMSCLWVFDFPRTSYLVDQYQ